jgi:hypothetical protein
MTENKSIVEQAVLIDTSYTPLETGFMGVREKLSGPVQSTQRDAARAFFVTHGRTLGYCNVRACALHPADIWLLEQGVGKVMWAHRVMDERE